MCLIYHEYDDTLLVDDLANSTCPQHSYIFFIRIVGPRIFIEIVRHLTHSLPVHYQQCYLDSPLMRNINNDNKGPNDANEDSKNLMSKSWDFRFMKYFVKNFLFNIDKNRCILSKCSTVTSRAINRYILREYFLRQKETFQLLTWELRS